MEFLISQAVALFSAILSWKIFGSSINEVVLTVFLVFVAAVVGVWAYKILVRFYRRHEEILFPALLCWTSYTTYVIYFK